MNVVRARPIHMKKKIRQQKDGEVSEICWSYKTYVTDTVTDLLLGEWNGG